MDIGDLFRTFFGLKGDRSGRRDFPLPDDEYCDCNDEEHDSKPRENFHSEFPFFFGHSGSSLELDDMFRHFHGDMYSQMESLHREMEDMMKGFGTIASEYFPPEDKPAISDRPDRDPKDKHERWIFGPPGSGNKYVGPRDFMLKEKDTEQPETSAPLPMPPSDDPGFHFKRPFRFFPWNEPRQDERKDSDLDGKFSKSDVMDLLKKSDQDRQPHTQISQTPRLFQGSSVMVTTVRRPDGKMEQTKVTRDSSGREESSRCRTVDGQSHTVRTVIGPDGIEERHEDFKNMDENDIHKFEERWKSFNPQRPTLPPSNSPTSRLDPKDMDLFSKFFKDPPK